jgi:hypothetical protein
VTPGAKTSHFWVIWVTLKFSMWLRWYRILNFVSHHVSLFRTDLFNQFLTIKKYFMASETSVLTYEKPLDCLQFGFQRCALISRQPVVMMKCIQYVNFHNIGKLEWVSVNKRRSTAASYPHFPHPQKVTPMLYRTRQAHPFDRQENATKDNVNKRIRDLCALNS